MAIELNTRPTLADGKRTTMIAAVDVKAGHLAVELTEDKSLRYDSSLAERVDRLAELRRRIAQLARSSVVNELQNTIWRLSEMERRFNKAARRAKLDHRKAQGRLELMDPRASAELALLPAYRQKMAILNELESKTANAEDEALLLFYGGEPNLPAAQIDAIQEVETALQSLLRQLLDQRNVHPNRVTMAVYSENKDALFELAQAYYTCANELQMRVMVSYYTANLTETSDGRKKVSDDEPKTIEMFGRNVFRRETDKAAEFFSLKPEATTGIVFSIEGKSAFAMWGAEHGLHTFVEVNTKNNLLVHTTDVIAKDYVPPSLLQRRGAIQPTNVGPLQRTYQRPEGYIEDHLLTIRRLWSTSLPEMLSFFVKLQLQRAAENLIDG